MPALFNVPHHPTTFHNMHPATTLKFIANELGPYAAANEGIYNARRITPVLTLIPAQSRSRAHKGSSVFAATH